MVKKPAKFWLLSTIGACSFLVFMTYTKTPRKHINFIADILHMPASEILNFSPEIHVHKKFKYFQPLSYLLSPFIYRAPKGENVMNLKSGDLELLRRCRKLSSKPNENCAGERCLCVQSNPVLVPVKHCNNSVISNQKFHQFELDVMYDEPNQDPKFLPDGNRSKLTHISGHRVGEDLTLFLELFNSYGKKMTRGGDDLRVRMEEKKKRFSIAGRVTDFNNGTYLITFPTIWNGSNTIEVFLSFSREERAVFLRWTRQMNSMFYHRGVFSNGNVSQDTLCAPFSNIPGYKSICNFTELNGGDFYFCGAPPSKNLSCSNISSMGDLHVSELQVTNGENFMNGRKNTFRLFLKKTVNITGKEDLGRDHLPVCRSLPPAETWNISRPTGFLHKNIYHPVKCRLNQTQDDIRSCVENTTILITGDSTSRQWHRSLEFLLRTKRLTNPQGIKHLDSTSRNDELDVTIRYAPHSMPFQRYQKNPWEKKMKINSIPKLLDEIPATGKVIFVIHHYAHCIRHHYSVLQNRYARMVPAIRRALKRNKQLVILVKGPHIFNIKHSPSFDDYTAPFVEDIIMEELSEFLDRLFYLNHWDVSLAFRDATLHPKDEIVGSMVSMLFAHTCPLKENID